VPRDAVGKEQRGLCSNRDPSLDLAESQELLQRIALLRAERDRYGSATAMWTIDPGRRVDHVIAGEVVSLTSFHWICPVDAKMV
jgi:hypothetical protein